MLSGISVGDTMPVGTNSSWLYGDLCNFEIFSVLLVVYL